MSSNIPADLYYTESHEWVRPNDDGTVTVGITDHAQHLLGDLVFVEIPEVGRRRSGWWAAAGPRRQDRSAGPGNRRRPR